MLETASASALLELEGVTSQGKSALEIPSSNYEDFACFEHDENVSSCNDFVILPGEPHT